VSVIGVVSVPITLGLSPEAVAVRIHASEGWGRPAVDTARVYFLSKRHELIAVARNTGLEEWRASLGRGMLLTAGTTVLIAGATVVAGDGDVFGFDCTTGALKWRFRSVEDDVPGRFVGASPDGLVLTGSRSGRVYAVDAETGALRWTSPTLGDHVLVYPPATAGEDDVTDDQGTIAVTYADFSGTPRTKTGGVVLLDAAHGSVRWRTEFPDPGHGIGAAGVGPPALAGPIVAAASSDGTVYGFDRSSGAIVWSLPPVGSHDPAGGGAPQVEDVRALAVKGLLVATSLTGTLIGVDLRNGRELWRSVSPLDGSIAFAAVTDGQVAYLPHISGWLVAVNLADGTERWRVGGSGVRFEHPPAVFEHRVYATSAEGLYAVDDVEK